MRPPSKCRRCRRLSVAVGGFWSTGTFAAPTVDIGGDGQDSARMATLCEAATEEINVSKSDTLCDDVGNCGDSEVGDQYQEHPQVPKLSNCHQADAANPWMACLISMLHG